jgi:DNA ligase-1
MTSVYDIIQELNLENGSNYKIAVLKKYADDTLLQRVLKMTYDRVSFTYGITMKNIRYTPDAPLLDIGSITLAQSLDILENEFINRNTTGNDAIELLELTFMRMHRLDAEVLKGIINRDQRINMGRSNINKVFKDLIVKPLYMRCGTFTHKTKTKIKPNGAYVQLKADGTYREFTVENGVACNSRSGESYDYPEINKTLVDYPDGHYIGELTVHQDGEVLPRAIGNGMINSDDIPHDDLVLELWDYITLEEYTDAANKIKGTTPYHKRFQSLVDIVGTQSKMVRVIETHIVTSFKEALVLCMAWMEAGLEGAIIKDAGAIFRDGTSPQQLKMKLIIEIDVRITGFKPGRVGTKREGKIGSIEFATDDGEVKGFASGFTDAQLDDMDGRRDTVLGQIMTVLCNDITKGRSNAHYALSHPRFVEIRTDKTHTDTLADVMNAKEMAMAISE